MLEQFVRRNCLSTIEFLSRIGLWEPDTPTESKCSLREHMAIAYQNAGLHRRVYQTLLCEASSKHIGSMVFCACCGSVVNYLRNVSLLRIEPTRRDRKQTQSPSGLPDPEPDSRRLPVIASPGFRPDSFTNALRAAATGDTPLLLDALSELPLFWDGFLMLVQMVSEFVPVHGPLSGYFYMLLKIHRGIDPPGFRTDYIRNLPPSLDALPYAVPTADLNMLGAFLYACGDSHGACAIFRHVFLSDQSHSHISSQTAGSSASPPNKHSPAPDPTTTTSNNTTIARLLSRLSPSNSDSRYAPPPVTPGPTAEFKEALQRLRDLARSAPQRRRPPFISASKIISRARPSPSVPARRPSSTLLLSSALDFRFVELAALSFCAARDQAPLFRLVELHSANGEDPLLTQCLLGVYYASIENYPQAKSRLLKFLSRRACSGAPSPTGHAHSDIQCLLGHVHAQLNETSDCVRLFASLSSLHPHNFRILHSAAQSFFILDMFEYSLYYSTKALACHGDGLIWKIVGRACMHTEAYAKAVHAFEKASMLGEHDALLYMAELCNKLNEHDLAIPFYEQYMAAGKKNRAAVAKYLVEYFEEHGEMEKTEQYREMLLDGEEAA